MGGREKCSRLDGDFQKGKLPGFTGLIQCNRH